MMNDDDDDDGRVRLWFYVLWGDTGYGIRKGMVGATSDYLP